MVTCDNVFNGEMELVQISRVCTGRENRQSDVPQAITNLVRRQHWAVFDHAYMTFTIEAPIYVMRQWMRHKEAWMEKSRRFTKDDPTFGELSPEDSMEIISSYQYELASGKLPEDARKILPLDTMTKCVWTASLRTVFHFLRLRLDIHAQKEIRVLAEELAVWVEKYYPNAFLAWVNYDFLAYSVPNVPDQILEVRRGKAQVADRRKTIARIMERTQNFH